MQKRTSPSAQFQTAYGVNSLNEITNAIYGNWNVLSGWTGTTPVSGATTSPATNVTVNGSSSSLYGDNTFSGNENVVAGTNIFTAIGYDVYGRTSTNVSSVTVIPTNNAYAYDFNGNLLTDGTRNFAYDDENQLISVWQTNTWRTDFAYDGKLRRRIMKEFMWTGSSWLQTNEVHYVYDGNVVVQERNASNLPLVTYTRGTDLSGSMQGAGGIGGLLARTDNSKLLVADPSASAYYHCDGSGNVTCLINPYQQIAAKYLYDPFGNMLSMYGSLAVANAYRFSSKEWSGNSGLYYYLYRFYNPNLQRWPNRDPLGDFVWIRFTYSKQVHTLLRARHMVPPDEVLGNPNLFLFVGNVPVSRHDPFGLCDCDTAGCTFQIVDCLLATAIAALACAAENPQACQAASLQASSTCAHVLFACKGCGGVSPPPWSTNPPGPPWDDPLDPPLPPNRPPWQMPNP